MIDKLTDFVTDWVALMERLDWLEWPRGQCGIASLTLAPALRVGFPSWSWEVCVGRIEVDRDRSLEMFKEPSGEIPMSGGRPKNLCAHCWIQGRARSANFGGGLDVVIVDPTSDQFGPDRPLVRRARANGLYSGGGIITLTPERETYLRSTINTYRRDDGKLSGGSGFKEIFELERLRSEVLS